MNELDWILFGFGISGWVIAWLTSTFYAKAFHALSNEAIEMLKDEQEHNRMWLS